MSIDLILSFLVWNICMTFLLWDEPLAKKIVNVPARRQAANRTACAEESRSRHPEGGEALARTHNAAGFAPEHDPAEIFDIAKRLMKNM